VIGERQRKTRDVCDVCWARLLFARLGYVKRLSESDDKKKKVRF
jgi:hypothetical protein